MVIVKIQDLPQVGNSQYARICNSSSTTYLNEPGYEITFIHEPDYVAPNTWPSFNRYACKGWDCPADTSSIAGGNNAKCGVSNGANNIRNLVQFLGSNSNAQYDTPCINYDNAYIVNRPDEKGYVIGCPNGLQIHNSGTTINPAQISTSSSSSSKSSKAPTLSTSSSESSKSTSTSSDSNGSFNQAFTPTPSSSLTPFQNESSGMGSGEAQESNEVVNLSKVSTQLGAGAIVGIVFASIAGFTILTVLLGVAGFVLLNLSSKGSMQAYSFLNTTRTVKV